MLISGAAVGLEVAYAVEEIVWLGSGLAGLWFGFLLYWTLQRYGEVVGEINDRP